MNFNIFSNCNMDSVGAERVAVNTTGLGKTCFTVIQAFIADNIRPINTKW